MQKREKEQANLGDIKLLIMDVDGVLTDGRIEIAADGSESKQFSVVDGHGIHIWHLAGLQTAIISGRQAEATRHRAEQLGINYVLEGCHEKLPAFEQLLADSGFSAGEVAYIGDDVLDLPIILRAGFGAAVANAVDEVKQRAQYVTTRPGGHGAVREVVEYILKATGRWQELMQAYLV